MRYLRTFLITATVLAFAAVGLSGMEAGRTGLVVPAPIFGDTPAIGLQHHFTPEISVRPLVGVGFERETSEDPDTTVSTLGLELDLGLNYHFVTTDMLSVYGALTPGLALVRTAVDIDGDDDSETETSYRLGLGAGVQHMFTNAFGLYADTGLRFNFDSDDDTTSLEIGTRTSNLGVIVYLN